MNPLPKTEEILEVLDQVADEAIAQRATTVQDLDKRRCLSVYSKNDNGTLEVLRTYFFQEDLDSDQGLRDQVVLGDLMRDPNMDVFKCVQIKQGYVNPIDYSHFRHTTKDLMPVNIPGWQQIKASQTDKEMFAVLANKLVRLNTEKYGRLDFPGDIPPEKFAKVPVLEDKKTAKENYEEFLKGINDI